MKKLFSSEQVGGGHPDKLADQISDAVLDACLKQDPKSRVACETMLANRLVVVGGEITTDAYVDITAIAWLVLEKYGYNAEDFTIISNINRQSPDINQGVDREGEETGAGDQGIMFGFATNETPERMPLAWVIANEGMKRLEIAAREKNLSPNYDMKAQVTLDYTNETMLDTFLMSCQHYADKQEELREVAHSVMIDIAKDYNLNVDFKKLFNPTGQFIIGGPIGDAGLTGRKIIADTYGGAAKHGGGAFSGKDLTKVDRSAAYAARWIAKNIIEANLADKCEIQLSYAIGVARPTSLSIETFGTAKMDEDELLQKIADKYPLTPDWIIKKFNLTKPIFSETCVYGHFGKPDLPWEQTEDNFLV